MPHDGNANAVRTTGAIHPMPDVRPESYSTIKGHPGLSSQLASKYGTRDAKPLPRNWELDRELQH